MRTHFAVLMWIITSQIGSDIDFECLPLDIHEGAEV